MIIFRILRLPLALLKAITIVIAILKKYGIGILNNSAKELTEIIFEEEQIYFKSKILDLIISILLWTIILIPFFL